MKLSQTTGAHVGWDVFRGPTWIDKVFFTPDCDAQYVLESLIDHDGYPNDIRVVRERGWEA
jgi:hypothetical protein